METKEEKFFKKGLIDIVKHKKGQTKHRNEGNSL